jgi:hypothetical protein
VVRQYVKTEYSREGRWDVSRKVRTAHQKNDCRSRL